MTTCEKCGRPKVDTTKKGWLPSQEDACYMAYSRLCRVAAEGFARGRAAGMKEAIEVAKERADVSACCLDGLDWSDVDREIARRLGDAESIDAARKGPGR